MLIVKIFYSGGISYVSTDMLNKAREGKYAVGHFNINNLEWAKSILLTAQEMNAPVILGVSEGAGKYMGGFKVVADMVKALTDSMEITVPVALHRICKSFNQRFLLLFTLTTEHTKDATSVLKPDFLL